MDARAHAHNKGAHRRTGLDLREDAFIRNNAGVPWFCFYGPRGPHKPYTPSAESEHYADDIPLRRPVNFNEPDGMEDKPTGVGLRTALSDADIASLEEQQEGSLEGCRTSTPRWEGFWIPCKPQDS